jgi:hypothetical protein
VGEPGLFHTTQSCKIRVTSVTAAAAGRRLSSAVGAYFTAQRSARFRARIARSARTKCVKPCPAPEVNQAKPINRRQPSDVGTGFRPGSPSANCPAITPGGTGHEIASDAPLRATPATACPMRSGGAARARHEQPRRAPGHGHRAPAPRSVAEPVDDLLRASRPLRYVAPNWESACQPARPPRAGPRLARPARQANGLQPARLFLCGVPQQTIQASLPGQGSGS